MPMPGAVPVPAPAPAPLLAGSDPTALDDKTLDGDASSAAGLTEDEKKILQTQLDAPNDKIGYFTLFRYANKQESLIMLVSFLASVAAGACLPLMS